MCYQAVKAYQKRVSFEREREAHKFLLHQAEQRIEAQYVYPILFLFS